MTLDEWMAGYKRVTGYGVSGAQNGTLLSYIDASYLHATTPTLGESLVAQSGDDDDDDGDGGDGF